MRFLGQGWMNMGRCGNCRLSRAARVVVRHCRKPFPANGFTRTTSRWPSPRVWSTRTSCYALPDVPIRNTGWLMLLLPKVALARTALHYTPLIRTLQTLECDDRSPAEADSSWLAALARRSDSLCARTILSPRWGSRIGHFAPTACAVGCILTPLRG
jgi:hypothetical protein